MRVDAVETIPKRASDARPAELDAAASLAVKNFVAALENEDSLFNLLEPLRGLADEETEKERTLSGEIVLAFKERNLADQKNLHFLLVGKLIELLKKEESQETLETKICVIAGSRDRQDSEGNALCIQLKARGQSMAQAMLRWSLGLAQLQQALLFTSRYLRQRVAHGEN
jgi:hypothetical protein